MGFREDIVEEQQAKDLRDYLNYEIEMARYENKPTASLESIRDSLPSSSLKH